MTIDLKDSERLIASFSRMVLRRMHAAKAYQISAEDIYNESVIAWCLARDAWDPNGGASFKTFFWRGLRNHINRWAQKQIHGKPVFSFSLDDHSDLDLGEGEMHDLIADERATSPFEALEQVETRTTALETLSPPARKIVDFLLDPPPEVEEELRAIQHKKAWAKELGVVFAGPTQCSLTLAFDMLGVNRVQRARLSREIERVATAAQAA